MAGLILLSVLAGVLVLLRAGRSGRSGSRTPSTPTELPSCYTSRSSAVRPCPLLPEPPRPGAAGLDASASGCPAEGRPSRSCAGEATRSPPPSGRCASACAACASRPARARDRVPAGYLRERARLAGVQRRGPRPRELPARPAGARHPRHAAARRWCSHVHEMLPDDARSACGGAAGAARGCRRRGLRRRLRRPCAARGIEARVVYPGVAVPTRPQPQSAGSSGWSWVRSARSAKRKGSDLFLEAARAASRARQRRSSFG